MDAVLKLNAKDLDRAKHGTTDSFSVNNCNHLTSKTEGDNFHN